MDLSSRVSAASQSAWPGSKLAGLDVFPPFLNFSKGSGSGAVSIFDHSRIAGDFPH